MSTTTSTQAVTTQSSFNGVAYGLYQQGNFKINWIFRQNSTDFTLTINIGGQNNAYGAIGFSNDQKMVGLLIDY